jgi:glutathione S-transferase
LIEVHHLNNSRSQRVLWLLEELGLAYEIVKYQRDTTTNLAPPSLRAIHPLGKSPVVKDGEQVLIESGAILQYLVDRYGEGRLTPAPGTPDALRHLQLMHYAEGSAMLPLMLKLYLSRLGDAGAPLQPRVQSEIENHFGFLDHELAGREWFVGDGLTAADVQLSFPIQAARMLHGLDAFPRLAGFLERVHARPAYRRALERGGPYAFGS